MARVKDQLGKTMQPTDWVVSAVDFHIYGQILDRLIEESPEIYNELSKDSAVNVADKLQQMVWEYLYERVGVNL